MSPPAEPLSFEDLTEVYRREQRSKALSEVRRDFYPAMRECLERLKRESEREFAADQFSTKAKLASNQLMKFQEKAALVFEFRMGKILDMALRAAQGSKVESTKLTAEEREVYDRVHSLLKERHLILLESGKVRVSEAEEPTLVTAQVPEMVVEAEREEEVFDSPPPKGDPAPMSSAVSAPERKVEPTPTVKPVVAVKVPDVPSVVATSPPPPPSVGGPPADAVVLRILEDIPAFAGPDRNYTLKKEDLVSLPPGIAKALVARKKAVGVSFGAKKD